MNVVIIHRNMVHPHSQGGALVLPLADAQTYARKAEPFFGAWMIVPAHSLTALNTPTARDMDHFANR